MCVCVCVLVHLNYFSTTETDGASDQPKAVEDMTYYEILGLNRHASSQDIKDAFREMGVSWSHEDNNFAQFKTESLQSWLTDW